MSNMISSTVKDYYEWYDKKVLYGLLDHNDPHRNYNVDGAKRNQWENNRYNTPLLSLHYKKTICMYLSGEQDNSGTSVFLYNKTKETKTHMYHHGFITPPENIAF